jgi:hypothetical protein
MPPSLKKLLRGKGSGRSKEGYESSVDTEHPVRVDHSANPAWDPSLLCWEAKGACALSYARIETVLLEELYQSRKESFCAVGVSFYMVGESPETAKPVIILSSVDRRSRQAAKKAIESSDILKNLNFRIRLLKYLPTGDIHPVASMFGEFPGDSKSTPSQLLPGDQQPPDEDDMNSNGNSQWSQSNSFLAYYDLELPLRTTAMSIYVKTTEGSVRKGTANVAYNGTSYGYITAAHVFKPWDQSLSSIDDREDDLGMSFDSDSSDEFEEHEGDGASSTVSLGSTSPQISYRGGSGRHQPPASAQSSIQTPLPTEISAGLLPLGSAASGEDLDRTLDYAMIKIEEPEIHQQLAALEVSQGGTVARVASPNLSSSPVIAWTSHGPVHGTLMKTPIIMRLPGSDRFRSFWGFTYEGVIMDGDCGSLVSDDTSSKKLYGMVIAASDSQSIAYVVAADDLVKNLEGKGGWHLLDVYDGRADSSQSRDIVSYPQDPAASQAASSDTKQPTSDSSLRYPQNPANRQTVWPGTQKWSYGVSETLQPEWNAKYARYLRNQWDEEHQRWYWLHYVDGIVSGRLLSSNTLLKHYRTGLGFLRLDSNRASSH